MKTCSKCNAQNLNSEEVCVECGSPLDNASGIATHEALDVNHHLTKQIARLNDTISMIKSNTRNNNSVIISDINMPFGSMVVFMVKWAIAAIPAAIILFILGSVLIAFFGGLFAALLH